MEYFSSNGVIFFVDLFKEFLKNKILSNKKWISVGLWLSQLLCS
jgi:uroporphyrinogen-III synthase